MPAAGVGLAQCGRVCEPDAMPLRAALLSLALVASPLVAHADVAPRCRCDAPGRSTRAAMVLPLALAALVPIALRRRGRRPGR
jgi:hypothetical protein